MAAPNLGRKINCFNQFTFINILNSTGYIGDQFSHPQIDGNTFGFVNFLFLAYNVVFTKYFAGFKIILKPEATFENLS